MSDYRITAKFTEIYTCGLPQYMYIIAYGIIKRPQNCKLYLYGFPNVQHHYLSIYD